MALSVIATAPVRVPAAVGVKVTLSVQKPAEGRLLGQSLVWEKSPLATMLLMFKPALPAFYNLAFCAGLEFPTAWGAKPKLVGTSARPGAQAKLIFATKASSMPPPTVV